MFTRIVKNRLICLQQNVDEGTIQLGPGGRGFGNWGRGSSGGIRPASQEADRPAPANRYGSIRHIACRVLQIDLSVTMIENLNQAPLDEVVNIKLSIEFGPSAFHYF